MAELRRKVLLVDDSKTFQSLFRSSPDLAECELFFCASGAQALELIDRQYIDFICSSYYLADMEGTDLCRRVRQMTRSAYKPFVLLTSVSAEDALTHALPSGVTDIFQKNDVAQLLAFIKRFPFAGRKIDGRILYVEDTRSQRDHLQAMLARHGLVVDAFSSADQAWPHFLANSYDLVLTDIVLDGKMSGLAFVNQIRRQANEKGDTPILALTAFDDKTRRIELFNLGVTDYIIKPVAEEELCVRIDSLIKLRRLSSAIALDQQRQRLEKLVVERTQELETVNHDLQRFSYSVSHDMRAPLRAISGYCQILLKDEAATLSPAGHDMLDRVVVNSQRMAVMIDEILEYSRASNLTLERRSVDLAQLASEIVARYAAEYPQAKVTIGELPTVFGDLTMLTQVMQNLIGNALKYSAHRTAPAVEIGATSQDGATVCYVRDNGAGFDMQYADKLFGLFQRMHKQSEFPGTGVGLAIVKRLIERHGGRTWAEAEPDRGATFYFTVG